MQKIITNLGFKVILIVGIACCFVGFTHEAEAQFGLVKTKKQKKQQNEQDSLTQEGVAEESYFDDETEEEPPPPPKTKEQRRDSVDMVWDSLGLEKPKILPSTMREEFAKLKGQPIDSSSVAALEARNAELTEQIRHLDNLYLYHIAYFAEQESIDEIGNQIKEVRGARALIRYRLEDVRAEVSKKLREKVKELSKANIADIYDVETNTYTNPTLINELRQSLLDGAVPPDIDTHAIGLVVPECDKFGINPKTPAKGHRMSIGQKHNLLIVKIENEGTKLILWDKHNLKLVNIQ
ncbi:MAG: hypothetical protein JJT94_07740 [Bernardetiaceae bacterium]|nr:hypothetical protein [Bernardetiaceae bacterium]